MALVALAPETANRPTVRRPRWRPQRIAVPEPPAARSSPPPPTGLAAFAVFGMFTSLAPTLLAGVLHERSHALAGAVVFAAFASGAAAQILVRTPDIATNLRLGAVILVPGLALLSVAMWTANLPLFVVGGIVTGAAGGLLFRGAMSAAARTAPAESRAETLAGFFLGAYVGLSLPVIGLGVADAARLGPQRDARLRRPGPGRAARLRARAAAPSGRQPVLTAPRAADARQEVAALDLGDPGQRDPGRRCPRRRRDRGLHLHRLDGRDGLPGARRRRPRPTPEGHDPAERRRRPGPASAGSAFSVTGTSLATERSRTWTGRSWPLRVHITVRMPALVRLADRLEPGEQAHALLEHDLVLLAGAQAVEVLQRRQDGEVAVLRPRLGEVAGRAGEEQPVERRARVGGRASARSSSDSSLLARLERAAGQGLGAERFRPAARRVAELAGQEADDRVRDVEAAPGRPRTRPGRRRRRPGAGPGRRRPCCSGVTLTMWPRIRSAAAYMSSTCSNFSPSPSAIACWRRLDSWPPGISWT